MKKALFAGLGSAAAIFAVAVTLGMTSATTTAFAPMGNIWYDHAGHTRYDSHGKEQHRFKWDGNKVEACRWVNHTVNYSCTTQ